jgi:hypothetical protein
MTLWMFIFAYQTLHLTGILFLLIHRTLMSLSEIRGRLAHVTGASGGYVESNHHSFTLP